MAKTKDEIPIVFCLQLPDASQDIEQPFCKGYFFICRTLDSGPEQTHWLMIPSLLIEDPKAFKTFVSQNLPGDIQLASDFSYITDPNFASALLEVEREVRGKTSYKFGVVCAIGDKVTESAMLGNNEISPEFQQFLDLLGPRFPMLNYSGFSGGLPTNDPSTSAIVTKLANFPVVFHVAPYMKYVVDDPQHLQRKRHIGNDVAVVIFKQTPEPLNVASIFRSQFIHVIVIVEIDEEASRSNGLVHYRIAVASRSGCHSFAPLIPFGPIPADDSISAFLLHKLINSERSATFVPAFFQRIHHASASIFKTRLGPYLRADRKRSATALGLHRSTPDSSPEIPQQDLVQKALIQSIKGKKKETRRSIFGIRSVNLSKSKDHISTESPPGSPSTSSVTSSGSYIEVEHFRNRSGASPKPPLPPLSTPTPAPISPTPPPKPPRSPEATPRKHENSRARAIFGDLNQRPPPPAPPQSESDGLIPLSPVPSPSSSSSSSKGSD